MKRIFIWGIITAFVFVLTSCGKDNKTYVDPNKSIKDNKSVYKNEISSHEEKKEEKQQQNKEEEKDKERNEDSTQQQKELEETDSKPVSAYSNLSNEKIGWGLKRNDEHETPEVYQRTRDLFKKYNTIFVGNEDKKVVYLTFDEGYENGYTPKILDILKENDVKAAFFVTGSYVQKHPALVERMINEGHIVGNHTINHHSLPDLSLKEIEQETISLDRMVYDKWKYNMEFIRPPKGEYSERVLAILEDLGYTTTLWSFAYLDFDTNNQRGTDYAYKMIMDNLHDGAIYLLHAVSKDNANVLDRVIKNIRDKGYEFKTLDSIKIND